MVVLKVLREFAGGTSIHGFTFLVRPESSSWTKIIWTICLAVALTYATLEMRNSVVGKYDYITKLICWNLNINLFYNTLIPWDMGLLEVQTLQICSFEFEFEINELYTYLHWFYQKFKTRYTDFSWFLVDFRQKWPNLCSASWNTNSKSKLL